MIIKGAEGDVVNKEITLTAEEARILAGELIRAADESQDHNHPFTVDLFLLECKRDSNRFALRVYPYQGGENV
jgi:hypothetical protein